MHTLFFYDKAPTFPSRGFVMDQRKNLRDSYITHKF